MGRRLHMKAIGIKPVDLEKFLRIFFVDEFNQENELEFKKLNFELDIEIDGNLSKGFANLICEIAPYIEELYYKPTKTEKKEQVLEEVRKVADKGQHIQQGTNEKSNVSSEIKSTSDADVPTEEKVDELKPASEKKKRGKRKNTGLLLPLSTIDELLDQSSNYDEFLNKFADLLKVPDKRRGQFEALVTAIDQNGIGWKTIYSRVEKTGNRFNISDQQLYSKLFAKVFEFKIMKVLEYVYQKSNEKFKPGDADFEKELVPAKQDEFHEMSASDVTSTENAEESEKAQLSEQDKIAECTFDQSKVQPIINIDGEKRESKIFTCLHDLIYLDDTAWNRVEFAENAILALDKSLDLHMRIEEALKIMLNQLGYNKKTIAELADYLESIFDRTQISFDDLKFEDSEFKVKMRIKKAVFVFLKEFYKIEKVQLENFVEDLRRTIMSEDELGKL